MVCVRRYRDSGWADVDGISVSGDDVYVAGIQSDLFNYSNARLKNGGKSHYTEQRNRASDIFVSGRMFISVVMSICHLRGQEPICQTGRTEPVDMDSVNPRRPTRLWYRTGCLRVGYEFWRFRSTHYKGKVLENGV
jgi:hypothetical protein